VIKLSENVSKITLPAKKQVWRVIDRDGLFLGADVVGLWDEGKISQMHHPFVPHQSFAIAGYETEPLLQMVMDRGRIVHDPPSLSQTTRYCRERLGRLPAEYKRFENPHIYKVGLSGELKSLRNRLIAQHRK
jgi:nicotinate phosphoribosyltransferase